GRVTRGRGTVARLAEPGGPRYCSTVPVIVSVAVPLPPGQSGPLASDEVTSTVSDAGCGPGVEAGAGEPPLGAGACTGFDSTTVNFVRPRIGPAAVSALLSGIVMLVGWTVAPVALRLIVVPPTSAEPMS